MKLKFTIFFLICYTICFGQKNTADSLKINKESNCQEITIINQTLIPEYYHKNSRDTLDKIIKDWEEQCGITEEVMRCKILLAIDNRSFDENTYEKDICTFFGAYLHNTQQKILEPFTVQLAKDLLKREDLKLVEKILLNFYSNDIKAFEESYFMKNKLKGTKLYEANEECESKWSFTYGILLGAWIPQGNLKIVGNHPILGVRLGLNRKNLDMNIATGIKFLKSPNIYKVFYNDSIWETDFFLGLNLGLDVGYKIISIKKSSAHLLGGVGLDLFNALKVEKLNSKSEIVVEKNSLNLNTGIGYRYHLNPIKYFDFEFKYNFVSFKNNPGTDLSGNVLTACFIYTF